MATLCVLFRTEKVNRLFAEALPEPRPNPKQTFIQDTKSRESFPGPNNATRGCSSAKESPEREIEELCTATLFIDQTFYDVRRKLSEAANEQKKRIDLYDTCRALEAQWIEHHRTYQTLLWRSRELAGEAQSAVDDFRDLVLPSLKAPKEKSEKQKIIEEQLEVLQKFSQPSRNLSQEFLDFSRALDEYIAELSRAVSDLGIDEQSWVAAGLGDRLRSARDAVETVSREVRELSRRFAADVSVTGIALLFAFVTPTWWATLGNAAVIGIGCMNANHSGAPFFEAWNRCDLAVTEYKAIKAEYDMEKACLSQMAKLESTLHDSRPLVQEVTTKLGIFVNVWAAIWADILKLKGVIQRAGDPNSSLFTSRVEKLEELYGYLSHALRQYQVTVCPRIPGTLPPL